MLNSFRKLSGGFAAKMLLAFLVLTFAVWGIGDMVRPAGGGGAVATVGKTVISLSSYQHELRREMENIRHALGDRYSPEIVKSLGVERYVIRALVQRTLLEKESEALGIIPGDADVARRIRSNPAFQDEKGMFDKRAFEVTLARLGVSEKKYAENIRRDMASQLILETLAARAPVPEKAVEMLYAAQEAPRHVTIYTTGTPQPDKIAPPAAGVLESYYAERAQQFNAPELRHASYVVLTPAVARGKIDISEEALLAAYKERIDEFRRPERRAVEQLLYADEAEAKKAHALLQEGKPFGQVAKATPILNQNATALGMVEKHAIPEAAAETVFSLEAGKTAPPVQSGFGWHVFFVRAVEPAGTASLNDVREMLIKDLRARAEEESLSKLANRLEDTLAGGGSLEEAAKELGLTVHTLGPITRAGKAPDGSAVKIPDLEKFLDTTFATEERTESPLMHAKGGSYYLLRVDKVTPERSRALDEVRALALAAWRHDAASDLLAKRADVAAEKLRDEAARDETLRHYSLKEVYSGAVKRSDDKAGNLPLPPALKAELFSLPPGGATAAYPLPSGEYLLAIAGKRLPAATPDRAALQAAREQLAQDMKDEIVTQYYTWLAEKYPVVINESLLQSAEN